MVDPSSLGRIRNCTIIPVAAAASIVRTFGRLGPSMAWLRAFNQPVPQAWQLVEEQEENDAAGEADLVLNEQLDEQGFEAEDLSFADELTMMATFSTDQEDDERLKTYILQRVPPLLKSDLDMYLLARTATFAARRQGGAVQSISAESDRTALLRFYGYLERMQRVPDGANLYIDLLCRADLGDLVEGYATWLQNNQRCKFSTIANYLNGLVSLTTYAYANFEPASSRRTRTPMPLPLRWLTGVNLAFGLRMTATSLRASSSGSQQSSSVQLWSSRRWAKPTWTLLASMEPAMRRLAS